MKPEEYKQRDRERLQTKAKRLINADPTLAAFYKTLSKSDQEDFQLIISTARYHLVPHTSALDPIILAALLAQGKQILDLRNQLSTLRLQLESSVGAQHAAPSPRPS